MRISFRNSYRGKPKGFEDMSFTSDHETLVLKNTEFTGMTASILSKRVGPPHSCALYTNNDGLFTFVTFGIGRNGASKSNPSVWVVGDDTKIINLVLEEENECDLGKMLAVVGAFTFDYYGAGNTALDAMVCTPSGEKEYDMDYEKLSALWACDTTELLHGVERKPNKLYLYYVPYDFSSDSEKQYIVSFYEGLGIAADETRLNSSAFDIARLAAAIGPARGWKKYVRATKKLFK